MPWNKQLPFLFLRKKSSNYPSWHCKLVVKYTSIVEDEARVDSDCSFVSSQAAVIVVCGFSSKFY